MTLIACLHPYQCRTLISDTLVTSPNTPDNDVELPLRTYIPPERMRGLGGQPVELRRKVIEISRSLVELWAGDCNEAYLFADRAKSWFREESHSEDDLVQFLDAHYSKPVENFHAIIAPANQGWYYKIGTVNQSTSAFAGEFAVAGSGGQAFTRLMEEMTPRPECTVRPDVDGLRIASEFMAREILTSEPIEFQFGGAYEVLYCGQKGFERLDEVMHIFALVTVLDSTYEISHYSHATRQWYEGDQLYIVSYSTPSAHQQGMELKGFAIPDILGHKVPSARTVESLSVRPNYMCIHHIFEANGGCTASVMTIPSDAIDRMFRFSQKGEELVLEATDQYQALVAKHVEWLRSGIATNRLGNSPLAD